jgi:hypothetical protein
MTLDRRKPTAERQQFILNLSGAVVATALLGMLAVCLYVLLTRELPKSNEIMLSMVIGMITTKIGTIVDFHYGGSESNKKLAETVSTQAATAHTAQATLSSVTGASTPGEVNLQAGDQVKVTAEDK